MLFVTKVRESDMDQSRESGSRKSTSRQNFIGIPGSIDGQELFCR
jgi:hypothetical protein